MIQSQAAEAVEPSADTSAPFERALEQARELAQLSSVVQQSALSFHAPYVIDKLVAQGLMETREQAEALFLEVKRYLLLSDHLQTALPMSSALVDAAWHQFVLFTREYEAFCVSHFGELCHHVPELGEPGARPASIQPGGDGRPRAAALELTEAEFRGLYEASFGPIPDVWYDSLCLSAETRLSHRRGADAFATEQQTAHALLFRREGEHGKAELVCRASARALRALDFIAAHRRFLIRELPALNTDAERLTLCRPLVRYGILTVAL
jgi:hypothetical protein